MLESVGERRDPLFFRARYDISTTSVPSEKMLGGRTSSSRSFCLVAALLRRLRLFAFAYFPSPFSVDL